MFFKKYFLNKKNIWTYFFFFFIWLQRVACFTTNRGKSRHWDNTKWPLIGGDCCGEVFYKGLTIIPPRSFTTGHRLRRDRCGEEMLLEVPLY